MKLLNRTALVVRPRQPFIDWVNGLEEDAPLHLAQDDSSNEHNIYLVDEVLSDEHLEKVLKCIHPVIFESELYGWWTDESDWPKQRGYKTFRAWFEVEYHTMITDLSKKPLLLEEY